MHRREGGKPHLTPTAIRGASDAAGLPEMLSHWAAKAGERAFLRGWSSRHAHAHSVVAGARPRTWKPRARAASRQAACRLARSGRGQGERTCACADARVGAEIKRLHLHV